MPPAPTPAVHVTPTNAALGVAIRLLRRARKLTIEELAHAADMHPTYLSGIERGRRNPTWNKLTALARVLHVPMSVLTHDAEVQTQLAARTLEASRALGLTA